jgi:hypothetical protein
MAAPDEFVIAREEVTGDFEYAIGHERCGKHVD